MLRFSVSIFSMRRWTSSTRRSVFDMFSDSRCLTKARWLRFSCLRSDAVFAAEPRMTKPSVLSGAGWSVQQRAHARSVPFRTW